MLRIALESVADSMKKAKKDIFMVKNFAFSILFFQAIICAQPIITSFNYQTDMPAVEQILKKEWHTLFLTPAYDQNLISIIFKDQRPGDITMHHKRLFITTLKENTTLLGFITYYQADAITGHVELLAIDSPYKGLGYGKKLITYVQDWFSRLGCKYIQLYVYPNNNPAIQFYKHLGFSIKKMFPAYFLLSKQIG
jgi:GNAT superfamily N-acetyltransferase